ncbi:MAG: sensor histidine kinase [Candidatus Cyclobacteriaceae bacterium M3_2C_046]
MIDYLQNLFTADFMPHGHCYYWQPEILWPHAISDGIIALAYCAIPLALIYIFRRRNDFKYIWMIVLFAIFIFGCGLTHVFDVINIWKPYYRADSVVRVITAMASIGTAFVLVKVTPQLVKIPSAQQWKQVNKELETQLKQLQEKDRTIEAIRQFEYLAEAVPQIMWTRNNLGQLTYINRKWFEYTGIKNNQDLTEIESLWQDLVHPEDKPQTQKIIETSLAGNQKFELEYRLKGANGEYQWFLSRSLPMKDANNQEIKWFGTLTNIDDQKKQNQMLNQANKELIKINNDLDNFVYTASHDLKSPVTNLEGLLMLLKQSSSNFSSQEQRLVDLMDQSLTRLNLIMNDLSEVGKIQKDQITDHASLNIEKVIEDVKEDLSSPLKASNGRVNLDLSFSEIRFSPKNLRSIFYNLISNAINYRNKEKPLEIDIKNYWLGNLQIFEVKDNGIGIKPEDQEKIFGLFKRASVLPGGSGIGLFIVKRIVENAGGEIKVISKTGEGSLFRLSIPADT